MPTFSTLNTDVLPREDYLETLDKHMPKIDTELIKDIWRTIGLQSSDERVYKVASVMLENQMLKVIGELKMINAQQAQSSN